MNRAQMLSLPGRMALSEAGDLPDGGSKCRVVSASESNPEESQPQ